MLGRWKKIQYQLSSVRFVILIFLYLISQTLVKYYQQQKIYYIYRCCIVNTYECVIASELINFLNVFIRYTEALWLSRVHIIWALPWPINATHLSYVEQERCVEWLVVSFREGSGGPNQINQILKLRLGIIWFGLVRYF